MLWILLYLGVVLFWVTGSSLVHGFFNRAYQEQGRRFDMLDGPYEFCVVVFWPFALLLIGPVTGGKWLGTKLWVKGHKTELIQKELKNEEVVSSGSPW